jgi:hypothetical protein
VARRRHGSRRVGHQAGSVVREVFEGAELAEE